MDQRLVAWARAVKSRRRHVAPAVPPLWLFTDAAAMPDLVAVVARLPRGLCGVVFRHDGAPGRAGLGRAVLRLCRARRLWMVSAGARVAGARGAAGLHLRGGRARPESRAARPVTSSAHGMAELVRARRSGAALIFLSPAFPTTSHPGAGAIGPVRWAGLACRSGLPGGRMMALGGIQGRSVKRLPRGLGGAGAIGALLDGH